MGKRNYNYSISLARLLAMSFIVICHFFQYYDNELAWWFNVGVQIFFCISGFLYGSKDIGSFKSFYINNFKKILVPYFCFLIPVIFIYFFFAGDSITVFSALKALMCLGKIGGIEHLWFVPYILLCYAITPFLSIVAKKLKRGNSSIILGLFIGIFFLGHLLPFILRKVLIYVIGYMLAFITKEYGKKTMDKIYYFCFGGCILFNSFRIYVRYFLTEQFDGFAVVEEIAYLFLGLFIFLTIYIYIKNLKPSKIFKFSDRYSYYIYIVHQLFILSPFSLMNITPYILINYVIVVLAIIASAVALKYISDKTTKAVDQILCRL